MKSRTLAQALIETGHLRIDGKRVERPSDTVRVGSIVALPLRGRVRILRVLALPSRRGPAAEARACYEELGPSPAGQALTGQVPRLSQPSKGAPK